MNSISVRVADWQKDNADLRRIREKVFIAEQAVPPELEWDTEDPQAVHFLAYEGDYAIGTARLLPDGQIGRVSVLKDWRGLNVGDALLAAVIAEAERRGDPDGAARPVDVVKGKSGHLGRAHPKIY